VSHSRAIAILERHVVTLEGAARYHGDCARRARREMRDARHAEFREKEVRGWIAELKDALGVLRASTT